MFQEARGGPWSFLEAPTGPKALNIMDFSKFIKETMQNRPEIMFCKQCRIAEYLQRKNFAKKKLCILTLKHIERF